MIWEEKIGGKLSPLRARFLPLLNKVASARRGTSSNATSFVLAFKPAVGHRVAMN